MTKAVSSLSLCGRDEVRSELEKAMPCFFGLRTRVVSGRGAVSSSPPVMTPAFTSANGA